MCNLLFDLDFCFVCRNNFAYHITRVVDTPGNSFYNPELKLRATNMSSLRDEYFIAKISFLAKFINLTSGFIALIKLLLCVVYNFAFHVTRLGDTKVIRFLSRS